jgi:nucleoside-diphosphate-sugar epimerase
MMMMVACSLPIASLPSNRVVMVTGGAGFMGCHTAAALLRLGDNVVLVDNLSAHGYPSSVKAANLQVS